MVNSNMSNDLFPKVHDYAKQANYTAIKSYAPNGETDIHLQKKEKANAGHYLLIAAILVGVVIYAHKRFESS